MSRRRPFLFALFVLIFIAVSPCFSSGYKRVVSLSPYLTENLYSLGIRDNIIGVTMYDRDEIKKNKSVVGSFLGPNIEKIILLKPDLIIASKEGNRAGPVRKLEKLGFHVEVFGELHSYKDIEDNFLRLAALFGRQDYAEQTLAGIRNRLSGRKTTKPLRIFIQLGVRPIITAGRNTYIDEMITNTGGINIFDDVSTKYPVVSPEEILRRNPEVIVVVGMGEKTGVMNYWSRFPQLDAVRHKKIYFFEDTPFCSPTPLTYLHSVETLRKILQ